MTTTPYTQQHLEEHRGPQSSELHNLRIEQNYKDLTFLYNKINQLDIESDHAYASLIKQIWSIQEHLDTFDTRLDALEADENNLVFYSNNQIDTDRFNGSSFEVVTADRCTFHRAYNLLTLPQVVGSSVSKIRFVNSDGSFNISTGLETLVTQITPSADDGDAVIETSQPYDAIVAKPGRIWERNAVTAATDVLGAMCYLYIRIPNELSITTKSNVIMMTPYPIFDVDIMEIAYSTNPNVQLNSSATWTLLNSDLLYSGDTDAIGHVAPGAWANDEIVDSGAKAFYFKPKDITAFRLKLRQSSYYIENSSFVYSYGLSKLDVRYDKFLATGKTIVKLDAPNGDTISSITSVTPYIYNVPQSQLDDVFSYRVIWETALNSGTYTLTPVPLSTRVWLEITLNQVESGYTPSVSSVVVNYT